METIIKKQYGEIVLAEITAEEPMDWNIPDATHLRVSLPSESGYPQSMQQMGFQFVERMLEVDINLKKNLLDIEKAVRMKPVVVSDRKEEIKALALKSFGRDRRFHIEPECRDEVAKQVIDGWVEEIPEFYVCLHKDSVIGFLAMKEEEDRKSASIHLAAVDEKYRVTGAAMSLYANAVRVGMEKGYNSITGCIASYNTAVMNLYAYLGGTFSNPRDIYLKVNKPVCF